MPAITYDQFLTASTLALQGGEGGSASGVHRDWVKQLLPSALNKRLPTVARCDKVNLIQTWPMLALGPDCARGNRR